MVRANLLYAMRMKEVPGQPGRTRMQVGRWWGCSWRRRLHCCLHCCLHFCCGGGS